MPKMKTTVGVTVGIFDSEGKLLLRRRKEHDSITNLDYYGCWELPVVAIQETDAEVIAYDFLCRELVRGVKAETGFEIHVDLMPPFYPVAFKYKGEYDLAMVTPVCKILGQEPTENKIIFVDPVQLNTLAWEYAPVKKDAGGRVVEEGKGLVSGYGKRMHCLGLKALAIGSSNSYSRHKAGEFLSEIQKGWK